MIKDLKAWSAELVLNSSFIPDFGSLNLLQQAETRFDRYIQLLEMVEGNEPPEILHTLANSIRMDDDCGAYQVTIDTFRKFMSWGYLIAFIEVLAKVNFRRPDLASDLVIMMSQTKLGENCTFLQAFERELENSKTSAASNSTQVIIQEKRKGTLSYNKPELKLVVG